MTDPSPLAKAVLEACRKHQPVYQGCCHPDGMCGAKAEEIAQAVVGEWKRWVVTQVTQEEP